MRNGIADIPAEKAPYCINKLISFLGRGEVERHLEKYKSSLQKAGPIFGEYYLKWRHPWWYAFDEYFKLMDSAKSIKRHLTTPIKFLGGDAKKIHVLQTCMPFKIKEQYRRNLTDDKRAYDYLFEISIAWHYYSKGCEIQWHCDDSAPHSEFLVRASDFEFNVECKRISVDIARRVRRGDFYRLAEKLLPVIAKKGYCGAFDVTLRDRLKSNDGYLNAITDQVLGHIEAGNLNGEYEIGEGSVSFGLREATGEVCDLRKRSREFYAEKSDRAHGAIFTKSRSRQPIDPVEMTVMSQNGENVLEAIRERLLKAGRQQLDASKPGFIACFLAGIESDDLRQLASSSGIQIMTNDVLGKKDLTHIAGVGYAAEMHGRRWGKVEIYENPALLFRNPDCKFAKAKTFPFLGLRD